MKQLGQVLTSVSSGRKYLILLPSAPKFSPNVADCLCMYRSNDNLAPFTYWFVVALLRDPILLERCMTEMRNASVTTDKKHGTVRSNSGPHPENIFNEQDPESTPSITRYDPNILVRQPLLQSVFSECLRTEGTIMLVRSVEHEHRVPAGHTLPQGAILLHSTHVEHMDSERWDRLRPNSKSVNEFDPERFLQYIPGKDGQDEQVIFSTKGLESTFIPFGIGHNMCPGRHFAARAILCMAAMILGSFELQLESQQDWKPKDRNFAGFGYSSLRPKAKVPFRIRRKTRNEVHA